jgi:hypothetical protein
MARAFDRALLILGELGRDVRTRDLVVRIIINEAKRGERDSNMLCRAVLRRFGKSWSSVPGNWPTRCGV